MRDRTVVFYDPRGRGNSGPLADKTQVTLATEMEDPDLVRRRCELDQVVLFGWSYHGGVVANYAGRHPDVVLRMVLSGPIAPRRIPYSVQAAAMLQSRLDMTANRGFHEVGRPRIPRKHPRRGTPSYCAATSPIAGRTPAPFRNPANRRTNGPAMWPST